MSLSTRIAPTPSGYLHIGNLFSFYTTWLIVKKQQGKILLRIDDLDAARTRTEYLADIFESLSFMGINWDAGPTSTHELLKHFSQRLRLPVYHNLLETLARTGLVYACTCSRKITTQQQGPKACECRHKKLPLEAADVAWRIHVPEKTRITFKDELLGPQSVPLKNATGDFIIKRKDGIPAYQVASLADDVFYGINYIVRGQDLLHSTAAQLYLAGVAREQNFLETRFYHHTLITNQNGVKLSKSAGSESVRQMRLNGFSTNDIINMMQLTL